MKRGPKGDPNPQKGPLGDPGPLKGTHCVTVLISVSDFEMEVAPPP